MVNDLTKKQLLDELLESKEFSGSKSYQKLLKFLVEASIRGESPKEFTIASEVFGKSADFNPAEDTTVRVYMHNLRNKLERYYQKEGCHSKTVIDIPRGHYEVRFVDKKSSSFASRLHLRKKFVYSGAIFVALVLAAVWGVKSGNFQVVRHADIIGQDDPVWGDILSSPRPLLVVLGDHFFYEEYRQDIGRNLVVRDMTVNSMEDFYDLQSSSPEKELNKTENAPAPYFAMNSVFPLENILPILARAGKSFSLRAMSRINSHDILENDIIYVGSQKSLGLFDRVTEKLNVSFELPEQVLVNNRAEIDSASLLQSAGVATSYHQDVCLVAKVPGPAGNKILILTSYHATGTCGAAKSLADLSSLTAVENSFVEKYGQVSEYFKIVFDVYGYDRLSYRTEIKEFSVISSDIPIW